MQTIPVFPLFTDLQIDRSGDRKKLKSDGSEAGARIFCSVRLGSITRVTDRPTAGCSDIC